MTKDEAVAYGDTDEGLTSIEETCDALDVLKACVRELEAALSSAERWASSHAQIVADGETCEVSQTEVAYRAGYTRGWDDREAKPADFEPDGAWADYVRVEGERP